MNIPETLIRKVLPLLLVLAAALALLSDRLFPPEREKPAAALGHADHGDDSGHESHDDHSDPEKNRRMGIHHYNEGNRDLAEGKLDAAVDNYKMALSHNGGFVQAYINLSTTYLRAGRLAEAGETLDRLAEIDPENPHLFYNRACLHSLGGDTDAGLAALERAVALGYVDKKMIASDPDLAALRKSARYQRWFREWSPAAEKSGLP